MSICFHGRNNTIQLLVIAVFNKKIMIWNQTEIIQVRYGSVVIGTATTINIFKFDSGFSIRNIA